MCRLLPVYYVHREYIKTTFICIYKVMEEKSNIRLLFRFSRRCFLRFRRHSQIIGFLLLMTDRLRLPRKSSSRAT